MRQPVGDDRLHARLPEGAARLLVGKDRLQLHHLSGQRLDVALRSVDDGQPLLQLAEALMRGARLLGHRLAEPAGHRVEPLADRARQLGLPCAEHIGDGAHAALHFGLRLHDAGHPDFGVAGMLGGLGRGGGAGARRTPQRDDQRDEQRHEDHHAEGQGMTQRDRGRAEPRDRLGEDACQFAHRASIADSPGRDRSKREQSTGRPVDAFGITNYLKAMSIKPLVILPDPLLRLVSKPVERVDAPLRKLAADMLDTMYDAPGIGLAAIQVGEPLRMLVIDLAKEGEPPAPQIFVNPEIVESSDDRLGLRGGLPVDPGLLCRGRAPGERAGQISRRGRQEHEVEAEGLLATCLQHEIDHLNGVLFIDHISKLKRDMVVKKFKKLAKDRPPPSRMVG